MRQTASRRVALAGKLPSLGMAAMLVPAFVCLLVSWPARAQSGRQDPCADLGSFAVVDGAPVPRGQPLVAQPYQPCAELPGRPQPQVFIDAQVSVGGGNTQDPATGPQPGPGQRPVFRRR